MKINEVMNELKLVLDSFDDKEVEKFVNLLASNPKRKVLCYGAGRMGLSLKAFAMRLNHLGISAYFFGDTYVPPLNKDDILIAASNSGETKTVLSVVDTAFVKAGCNIVAVTANPKSTLAKYSHCIVTFKTCNGGLNSADDPSKINSIQPMTTLTEQAMFIFFDLVILELIEKMHINIAATKMFHSNVE